MIEFVKLTPTITLDDYAAIAYLTGAVHDLRSEAESLLPKFKGRSVLMLNSTAKGGGVAEMLPRMVLMLNEVGITARWAVMKIEQPEFFKLTKRIHNMVHGHGGPTLNAADKKLYEKVSRGVADDLRTHLKDSDLLVVHDPQPLGAGAMLKKDLGIHVIWRCHIGLDIASPVTRAAWNFLKPYAEACDHSIFSAPEYIPGFLASRASVIHPGIDPLSHKNRNLTPHKLTGVLCNAGLTKEHAPVLTPKFSQQATRLQPDGKFGDQRCRMKSDFSIGPSSRKCRAGTGSKVLARCSLDSSGSRKNFANRNQSWPLRHRRRIEIARLVLAGPDPNSVQDDPEGREVLEN